MTEALIISTAGTPIGKAYRGAFNMKTAPTLTGHAIINAVMRAGIDGAEVEDVIMGCAMQQCATGLNIGRFDRFGSWLNDAGEWHVSKPSMFVGPYVDCHRSQANCP